MINCFSYEYNFPSCRVFRILSFDGVKWCLTAFTEDSHGRITDRFASKHFTKETLSREFFERFPECRSLKLQSVKKIFTNS